MNFFIETFLEIVMKALKKMDEELKEKCYLLDMAEVKLNSDSRLKNAPGDYDEIMYILAQNHFLDASSGLTISELASILKRSPATIRKIVRELLDMSLIEQRGKRPANYCINPTYFEN